MNILISHYEAQLAAAALSDAATQLRNEYERRIVLYQDTGYEAHREAAQTISDAYQTTSAAARGIRQAMKLSQGGP